MSNSLSVVIITKNEEKFIRDAIQSAKFADEVLLPEMQAKSPEAGIEETFSSEVVGLEPEPESIAAALLRHLTGGNEMDVVSFGTEAGLFQMAGVSAVICGPGSIEQAHKPDEFISREQLSACLDMLSRVAGSLSK